MALLEMTLTRGIWCMHWYGFFKSILLAMPGVANLVVCATYDCCVCVCVHAWVSASMRACLCVYVCGVCAIVCMKLHVLYCG